MKKYKDQFSLEERKQKHLKQLQLHQNKIVLIVEKHQSSKLPSLINPKFLCQKSYRFNIIKNMLWNRICKSNNNLSNNSFFITINKYTPSGNQTLQQLYNKFHDQDGCLYLQYMQMQTF